MYMCATRAKVCASAWITVVRFRCFRGGGGGRGARDVWMPYIQMMMCSLMMLSYVVIPSTAAPTRATTGFLLLLPLPLGVYCFRVFGLGVGVGGGVGRGDDDVLTPCTPNIQVSSLHEGSDLQ